ncbi:class I SAM-dependent methyltransferase [Bradyrhizobium sp. Ai1a-2]|uniref:class I SAM-dependent methyltransferase n=1 Tax=Bradyrhizobium sp. Ai1a-2 TaxID=196490 RepID=UPI00040117AF|nr:class I SAM-dependent methyltransferase [Bradyrhizobium sp. Ai1a-2]
MQSLDRQLYWENVYRTKGEREWSWFQQSPQPSLGLIEKVTVGPSQPSIVDIGGGASSLVDELLCARMGFRAITVLDLSEAALDVSKARLGPAAVDVNWIVADVTTWQPPQAFDIWHDRAAFHFLVDEDDRKAYIERLAQGVTAGGHAIIATFAPDGPEKCSSLPVQRYDAVTLSRAAGSAFELVDQQTHRHVTPWDSVQSFQFSVLRRR